MKSLFAAAALSASMLSAAAFAYGPRPLPPPPPGVSYDRRDDVRDLRQWESLEDRYKQASRRRNVKMISALDKEVRQLLARELRESRADADRRALARVSNLSRSFDALAGRVDPRSVQRKLALIDEAVDLVRAEVRPAPRPRMPMARR